MLLSLIVVTLGAAGLVRGASKVALRAGLSPLSVGLTVVAFGTSAPELGSSLVATVRGVTDISVGNVVGSNIFNIAAIVGLTALIRPIRVRFASIRRDLWVAIAAAALPWSSVALDGVIPRWLGVLLVAVLVVYIAGSYRSDRRTCDGTQDSDKSGIQSGLAVVTEGRRPLDRPWADVLMVAGGIGMITIGSRLFVGSAIDLAHALGVTELVIGLTVVSMGTSLPELVTSLVAAARRDVDIAVGNIIGSNIFNSFGILGTCAAVKPQGVNRQVLLIDAPVLLVATLALLPIAKSGGRISRLEGGALILGYLLYLGLMIIRGK